LNVLEKVLYEDIQAAIAIKTANMPVVVLGIVSIETCAMRVGPRQLIDVAKKQS
jgi:hypothetical protein